MTDVVNDPRYPYTYAADYIRMIAGSVEGGLGTKLSRSDAAQIRSKIAEAIGLHDHIIACKLADKFLELNG